ncbi:hypothetical protein [Streptomyces sp. NBC_01443]|uniref:hypothetical protein n=1 Tax=Streptomyces sp. NBC_01443 TaxID=2903868 RepID=UPI00225395B9|nr:hypothetical protein [Streptomyces sp. NBC_01443]MCX4633390.1 hypothetical protein [Streptomyces sp. NBC_01443]
MNDPRKLAAGVNMKGSEMEFVLVALAVVLLSGMKKLVKSAADRNRAQGEALLIRARGEAARQEAKGKAEIIRARMGGVLAEAKAVRGGGRNAGA